jgi:hypothetical protein
MSLILINKDGPEIQKCWERTETTLPFVNVSVQMYGILKEELSFFEEEGFSEAIFLRRIQKKIKQRVGLYYQNIINLSIR